MKQGLAALLLLCVCACSETGAPQDAAPPQPAPEDTVAGDGSPFDLEPLAFTETSGLAGELGCSFAVGDDLLLIAMGFVASADRSEAMVKRAGATEELVATSPGGYDAMVEGAAFGARGLVVEIATQRPNETGNEQVAYNATLTAMRADGAERTYSGVWTCGP
jgi:hypothetical protein